jgi:hypothetical protein
MLPTALAEGLPLLGRIDFSESNDLVPAAPNAVASSSKGISVSNSEHHTKQRDLQHHKPKEIWLAGTLRSIFS